MEFINEQNVIKVPSPYSITLILTYKCSAACENCCFECSPKREGKMSVDFAKQLISQSIAFNPSIKTLVLTGGEVMLYFEELKQIISFGKEKNLICRIVTNGFWGISLEKAVDLLKELKEIGLDELNISTGDDHLEYVSIDKIKNCIIASLSLQIRTIINLETGNDRKFGVDELNRIIYNVNTKNQDLLSIINGMWMPFTKESLGTLEKIPENYIHPAMDKCPNLFSSITVSPNNEMFSCCGLPVKYIRYLHLGNLSNGNIADFYNNQVFDFLKVWLYVEGPFKILSYIENNTDIIIPEIHVLSHMCFYCACLFTNEKYLNAARMCYKKKYNNVMIKYYLLIKILNR